MNLKKLSLFVVFCSLGIFVYSQSKCKVLLPEIAEKYEGKCKKGLANGKGIAKGEDAYEGQFKKGLPNGYGTYTWSSGQVYKGEWKEGMKHGEGMLSFQINERDSIMRGLWENDEYIGPKPLSPYKVTRKLSVERYSVKRQGDGSRVLFYIMRSGQTNNDIDQFMLAGDSGTQFSLGSANGYEDIKFPFKCKVNYTAWNKLHSATYNVTFEVEINQPGEWKIDLHN